MTTLNELREKAKQATYEVEVQAEMEIYSKGEPEDSDEIRAAIREAEIIEAAMDELDEFYRTSGYTRLSCVAHKVSVFFTKSPPFTSILFYNFPTCSKSSTFCFLC